MIRTTIVRALAVLTLSLSAAYQAPAQDADSSSRGVARLSLLAGDVSVRRGDTGEWVTAAVNAPLLGEDQVLTGAASRAEVQFDYGTYARLSDNTELRLADIENRRYLVRLARGTMTFRILRSTDSQTEISTPSIAIRPAKKGIYRVTVSDDGTTEVTVRNGEAEIFTPKGSERLRSGRTLMARGSFSDPEFQYVNARGADDWDRWSESRDRQLDNSRSYDYVSQDIYGAEDLDNQGRWVSTPEYGNVWVPTTSVGWAPYRNGRWSWVDYYGWNWISYDPWGWAPYHYGRWLNRPGVGWCWWPGQYRARHYWSPAQVAFFGWGGGGISIGVGIGFG
ncbi:MAG TPA: FecR family protein, partial [Bryobacteraceae bacterium]|nr:FecR family protein [Bryobacteraceae bacterium]